MASTGLFIPTTEIIGTQLAVEAAKDNVLMQQILIRIIETINKQNIAINLKETGFFITDEIATGEIFFGATPGSRRQVFKKTIIFGALPAVGGVPKTVPHGLTPTANWSWIEVQAAATDPVGLFGLQIPYASASGIDDIEISVDNTNVIITTATNRSAFSRCFVTLKYIKQ